MDGIHKLYSEIIHKARANGARYHGQVGVWEPLTLFRANPPSVTADAPIFKRQCYVFCIGCHLFDPGYYDTSGRAATEAGFGFCHEVCSGEEKLVRG
jgi:hypothetical protein